MQFRETQVHANLISPWSPLTGPWDTNENISATVLHTATDRSLVAHLRRQADVETEYEVDPGMAALEGLKDELGVVVAILKGDQPIGTIRFIPAGHGVTLTERFWAHASAGTALVGPDSWEVGRLIMAPEHRRPDLLPRCMAQACIELLLHAKVQHVHASCHMRLTRLFRRFGFKLHARAVSPSGKDCALIHGQAQAVADALKVPLPEATIPVRQPLRA
jgi:predicted GNAT family N-acyltransferase